MKVLFIYPSISKKEYALSNNTIKSLSLEPLSIANLNGLTPDNWERNFYDDRLENINYDEKCDLVAMSVETYTAKRAYEIASEFRKRRRKVILGGFHPSICPDESLEYADSILIGEAENIWEKILNDVKNNDLKKIYNSKIETDTLNIKVDKSIFKNKRYFPVYSIESGRGCKFNCDFCSIVKFFQKKYRRRPIQDVVNEIKRSKKKNILFVDDNIVADINSAKKLFSALIPLKITWYSQASIDFVRDDELLDLMQKSGCDGLLISLESINKNNLVQMKKYHNLSTNLNYDAIKKINDKRIKIYASFVIGYDYDDKQTILDTINYAVDNKFFLANFYQLTPFPGTELYERFKKENKLIYDKWWLDDNYSYGDLVYKIPGLDSKEISNLCYLARKKFYSFKSILLRTLNFKANFKNIRSLFLFFMINTLVRKEIYQKQGRKLGRTQ